MGMKLPKDLEAKVLAMSTRPDTWRPKAPPAYRGNGRERVRLPGEFAQPDGGPESVTVSFGLRCPNPLNLSGKAAMAWRMRTSKQHSQAVRLAFLEKGYRDLSEFANGCVVRLTRASSGTLDEDAVPGAMKHVRDAVACLIFGGTLGANDSDPRCEWHYGQLRCPRGSAGVIVSVRHA